MNTYSDEDPRSVFFLDVTDGQDDIDQETGSRSNDENVSVIVKLVSNMAKRDRSILKDLAIVGFYNRQKWLLMERLCQMAASLDGSPSIENLGVKVISLSSEPPLPRRSVQPQSKTSASRWSTRTVSRAARPNT